MSIFETQERPYLTLQQVLVASNQPNKALEVAERGRARAFVELLRSRFFADPETTPVTESPTIAQIQQIASERTATLVEYSIIPGEALYIWVVQPTGEISFRQVDLNTLDIPLADLIPDTRETLGVRNRDGTPVDTPIDLPILAFVPGDLVKLNDDAPGWEPWRVVAVNSDEEMLSLAQSSFTEGTTISRPMADVVAKVESPHAEYPRLQQLHQLLIEPIADLLPTAPEDRIIFIPHRELFLVPFPALQDAEGKYLIEKHTMLSAPAIQALEFARQTERNSTNSNALIVGNPTMPQVPLGLGDSPQILSALPHAEREAEAIAQLFNTPALTGDRATKAEVVEKMQQSAIVHLATHGLLDDTEGIGSAIALAPSSTDNGLLSAAEILDLNLNAELVVLSACNTGQGRITGDGVVGLSRSLISAGAKSVVVSLWSIPDAPTADWMTAFYQHLQQHGDKAQALRQAMLSTMEQHPHPRNWAAFMLVGES